MNHIQLKVQEILVCQKLQLALNARFHRDFLLCDLRGLIESGYDMVIRENKPRLLMFKPLVWEGQTKMDLRGLHQWPVISRHNRSMYMSTSESWKKKTIFYKEKSIISIILEMLQTS